MNFNWLKSYMPRSLFARSMIILLTPIITLQLVIGLSFIQRHFGRVAVQMTTSVAIEINYVAGIIDGEADSENVSAILADLSNKLSMRFSLLPAENFLPETDMKILDISGFWIIRTLQTRVKHPVSVDLKTNIRVARIGILTDNGLLVAHVSRSRTNAGNPHQLLVMMITVSIILIVISTLFLKNQIRPIRRLAQAAEAFGKGQTTDFYASGAIEVRQAGQSFLDMRDRIALQIEQRTTMLSGVSHDLRTPLTRLKLAVEMLEDDEDTKHMVHDIEEMQFMINSFLEFSRGDSTEKAAEVAPEPFMQQIIDDQNRQGNEVSFSYSDNRTDGGQITMRPSAVSRAINNLITNALRFGDEVSVTVNLDDSNFRVAVEDNGPGIASKERGEAVKPFVTLDQSRNHNLKGGVGLGLSIATDIARSHGGELVLGKSEKLGGLQVVFAIPH